MQKRPFCTQKGRKRHSYPKHNSPFVSTSYSWLHNITPGRSSDFAINALLRLLKRKPFNDLHHPKMEEVKLLHYSDEFVQDLHLLPFSPNRASGSSDTRNVLFT